MKIRSQALLHFLLQQPGLNMHSPDDVLAAKKRYYALYKKHWKTQRKRCKEVRVLLTLQQFNEFQQRSELNGFIKVNHYAHELILTSFQNREIIPNKSELLKLLQLINRTYTLLLQTNNYELATQLASEAEILLLKYLKS